MSRDKRYHSKGVHAISTATGLLVAVFVSSLFLSPLNKGEIKRGWISPVNAALSSVVINEVMWMGSTVSASDEWIELRNMTDEEVNLNQWELKNAASKPIPLSGTIPPHGYFLIRRQFTDLYTTSALQLEPTQVASMSLANVNNTRGNLELLYQKQVVDTALGQPWPAGVDNGSGGPRQSMQRMDPPGEDGLLVENWYTCTTDKCTSGEFWKVGNDLNFGTPGAANSVPAVNTAPVPVISGASSGLVGQSLSWSAEDSTDAEGDDLTFSWLFGDGATATGEEVSHIFTTAGSFSVSLTVADAAAEAETAQVVTVTAPIYSTAIVVNEFLPNPAGSDTNAEFIELKNTSADDVDLSGWKLDDADGGSGAYTIAAGTHLAGGGIKSWSRSETKIALNNSGDSVRLLNPAGVVVSSHVYTGSVPEAQSYNRTGDGVYALSTTLTPGAANIITAPADEDEEDEETASATTGKVAGTTTKKISLADVREEEEGTIVTAEGVVSAPPGILGERELYLAGSGIQVYWHRGTWPSIKLGDKVTVTGTLGSNRGEARLKLAAATDVQWQTGGAPPPAHVLETGSISEDHEGWLVTVQGKVTETSGDTFYIDDGSGEVKIYIKESTKIDKPAMKVDTAVTITGIVSETTSGYRILPRFQEDVRLGLVAGLTTFPATGLEQSFGRPAEFLRSLPHLIRAAADGTIGE